MWPELRTHQRHVFRTEFFYDGRFLTQEIVMLNVDRDRRLAAFDLLTTNDPCAAANVHILGQRDLRGHHQRHVNQLTFSERQIRPQHRAA